MTLKMIRAEKDLTLEATAIRTGVSIPTLRKMEDSKPIQKSAIVRIAKYFKVYVVITPSGEIDYVKTKPQ